MREQSGCPEAFFFFSFFIFIFSPLNSFPVICEKTVKLKGLIIRQRLHIKDSISVKRKLKRKASVPSIICFKGFGVAGSLHRHADSVFRGDETGYVGDN